MAEDEKINLSDSSDSSNNSAVSLEYSETSNDSDNNTDSDYTATIYKNQQTIINNQITSISLLGTIAFLLIISVGIYLAFKFGKFIQNLID